MRKIQLRNIHLILNEIQYKPGNTKTKLRRMSKLVRYVVKNRWFIKDYPKTVENLISNLELIQNRYKHFNLEPHIRKLSEIVQDK